MASGVLKNVCWPLLCMQEHTILVENVQDRDMSSLHYVAASRDPTRCAAASQVNAPLLSPLHFELPAPTSSSNLNHIGMGTRCHHDFTSVLYGDGMFGPQQGWDKRRRRGPAPTTLSNRIPVFPLPPSHPVSRDSSPLRESNTDEASCTPLQESGTPPQTPNPPFSSLPVPPSTGNRCIAPLFDRLGPRRRRPSAPPQPLFNDRNHPVVQPRAVFLHQCQPPDRHSECQASMNIQGQVMLPFASPSSILVHEPVQQSNHRQGFFPPAGLRPTSPALVQHENTSPQHIPTLSTATMVSSPQFHQAGPSPTARRAHPFQQQATAALPTASRRPLPTHPDPPTATRRPLPSGQLLPTPQDLPTAHRQPLPSGQPLPTSQDPPPAHPQPLPSEHASTSTHLLHGAQEQDEQATTEDAASSLPARSRFPARPDKYDTSEFSFLRSSKDIERKDKKR